MEISSSLLPLYLVCSEHPAPSAVCPFQFLVCYPVFYLQGGVQSVQGAVLVYPRGSCGILCAAYLLTYWSASPKHVWSWHLVVQESSCFLSVTWHGEALYGLMVQCVRVLILLGGFFPAKSGSSISEKFLIYGAHAVCFCPLVAIIQ
jgi:hypothetical protein